VLKLKFWYTIRKWWNFMDFVVLGNLWLCTSTMCRTFRCPWSSHARTPVHIQEWQSESHGCGKHNTPPCCVGVAFTGNRINSTLFSWNCCTMTNSSSDILRFWLSISTIQQTVHFPLGLQQCKVNLVNKLQLELHLGQNR